MKNNRLFPGFILVLIGVAFLLNSMHVLHVHWSNLIYLWPLFIIIAGINLLLGNSNTLWMLPVRIIAVAVCLGVLLFGNFNHRPFNWLHYNFDHHYDNNDNDNDDDDNNDEPATKGTNGIYTEPWQPATKVATLNIEGGGTHYTLTDTTAMLMTAHTNEYSGNYKLDDENADSVTSVNFKLQGNTHHAFFADKSNTVNLKLNNKPLWDIKIKGGADELDFDLEKFKIRNLTLNGGATNYVIKMGMPVTETHVNIATGVSDITIKVPAAAACDVTTKSGLSSSNIDGLAKVGDNHYQSANFNNAANKLYINFNGGISDFKVQRY